MSLRTCKERGRRVPLGAHIRNAPTQPSWRRRVVRSFEPPMNLAQQAPHPPHTRPPVACRHPTPALTCTESRSEKRVVSSTKRRLRRRRATSTSAPPPPSSLSSNLKRRPEVGSITTVVGMSPSRRMCAGDSPPRMTWDLPGEGGGRECGADQGTRMAVGGHCTHSSAGSPAHAPSPHPTMVMMEALSELRRSRCAASAGRRSMLDTTSPILGEKWGVGG